MNGEERKPQSFSWMRRWGAGLNLIITVAAVLALVAMANYLVVRHFIRFHWEHDIEAELSKRTLQVLASLTNTVKVIVYYDSTDPLYPRVKGLLKEYQYASPRIDVQLVDYLRDAAAARAVKQQYQLNALNDKNLIIFESKGGKKVVNEGELSDYDTSELLAGKTNEVYRSAFKGELHFTSAIFSVASDRKPVAYFLIGHNEHSPEGPDNESYGKFTAMLRNENNFEVRPRLFMGTNEIPADCNLLIIAGASEPMDRTLLDGIQHYLEQGGRLLVAFSSGTARGRPTGLEQLLKKWGVEVGDNIVADPQHSTSGQGFDVVPVELGKHPIVNALQKSQLLLYMPRSVRALRPGGRTDEIKVEELLFTGRDTKVFVGQTVDPAQRGPKSLMAVVEKSVPALQRGSTRIVVVGDSTLWNNQWFVFGANADLAAFAANWLVSQNILLKDIPPRPIHTYSLTMTHTQLRSVQLILMAGLPGVVLLLGLLVSWRRRH